MQALAADLQALCPLQALAPAHWTWADAAVANVPTANTAAAVANMVRLVIEDPTRDWCIADLAAVLGWERSTVSARLNELKHRGELLYTGKKQSDTTGVKAMHFRLRLETLF